jgi:hypothetical protein
MDFIYKLSDAFHQFSKSELINLIIHLTFDEIKDLYIGKSYKLNDIKKYIEVRSVTKHDIMEIYQELYDTLNKEKRKYNIVNDMWNNKSKMHDFKKYNWRDRYDKFMKEKGLWDIRIQDANDYQVVFNNASKVKWENIFRIYQFGDKISKII